MRIGEQERSFIWFVRLVFSEGKPATKTFSKFRHGSELADNELLSTTVLIVIIFGTYTHGHLATLTDSDNVRPFRVTKETSVFPVAYVYYHKWQVGLIPTVGCALAFETMSYP